jgi:hypothetical protein
MTLRQITLKLRVALDDGVWELDDKFQHIYEVKKPGCRLILNAEPDEDREIERFPRAGRGSRLQHFDYSSTNFGIAKELKYKEKAES